jgi:hypothetical protein
MWKGGASTTLVAGIVPAQVRSFSPAASDTDPKYYFGFGLLK